ncbi:MAG: chaperone modulator CbpM, partial [Tannerellaceae bacterium]|nr:chaperone modulator CbpM [Tannerellaceae bacterium]
MILNEYCIQYNIEPSFVALLEEEGMIHIFLREGRQYLSTSELSDLQRFSRMYYDLSINP